MVQKGSGIKKKIAGKRTLSFINEIFVLYYGFTDSRTPFFAKLAALAALIYLVSPIDLIPDFIPVAGYLDDLVIVPLLLHVAFTLLPFEVKEAGWAKAKQHLIKLRIILAILLALVIGIMVSIFLFIKEIFHNF